MSLCASVYMGEIVPSLVIFLKIDDFNLLRFMFACICFGLEIRKIISNTVKPVQNGHSQKDRKLVFKTNYRSMQVISIAECSKESILHYVRHY